jgi:hypothetical protein
MRRFIASRANPPCRWNFAVAVMNLSLLILTRSS